MQFDEYWNKFLQDGKIESYLNYREHCKKQGNDNDRTDADNSRRTDNQRTEYR